MPTSCISAYICSSRLGIAWTPSYKTSQPEQSFLPELFFEFCNNVSVHTGVVLHAGQEQVAPLVQEDSLRWAQGRLRLFQQNKTGMASFWHSNYFSLKNHSLVYLVSVYRIWQCQNHTLGLVTHKQELNQKTDQMSVDLMIKWIASFASRMTNNSVKDTYKGRVGFKCLKNPSHRQKVSYVRDATRL